MEKPLFTVNSHRVDSWGSDTTYHSLYQHEDDKKTLISSNGAGDPYASSEEPKAALSTRFRWLHPLVHLLPVIATAGVVQLSFRGIYWADDAHYYKDWQTILQFPAKIHEILIVGSLSAMVLHIFRRMLIGTHGVPLGLMVGAFQMGSAEYLFSKSYWKPLIHSLRNLRRNQFKTFLVALALGSSIVYSFLVGPASAAALLPNLGWWRMRNPFSHRPMNSYIGRKASELYPTELKEANIYEDCLTDEYWNSLSCPAGGFNDLFDWAWTRQQEGYWYNVTDSQHYNPTMLSSFSGQAQRDIVTGLVGSVDSDDSATNVAMSATLHSTVLALTDAFWHYVNTNAVGKINKAQQPRFIIPQGSNVSIPLVQVQCQSYNLGVAINQDKDLTFETDAIVNDFSNTGSNAYAEEEWMVPDRSWNYYHPQPWNITNVTWVDTGDVKGSGNRNLPSSLAAVVTVPAVWSRKGSNGTIGYDQGSVVTPCVIDARWARTQVSFDITEPGLRTELTDWLNTANLTAGNVDVKASLSKWNIGEPIAISPDWAHAINYYNDLVDGVLEQILQQFVTPFSDDEPDLLTFVPTSSSDEKWTKVYANGISIVLSTVIADWISRTALADTSFTTVLSRVKDGNVDIIDLLDQKTSTGFTNVPVSDFADQTEIIYSVERYGWGYGLNSKTIWFSIITLLIHVVLVIAYFAYSFVFWIRANGWTSQAWGDVGEVIALAISSPPADELRNTGAGIDKSQTWMTALRLRESGSAHDKLELVIGTRGGTVVPSDHRLKIGKKYS
ncbi:hypothetical protein F5Y08DRAFT_344948 [Xylaria arbuscula]|nr:hypothetical protein F5Y08DRAFT_344948 [Xylaria arbuscula]